jgi:hypothetical protein
MRTVLPFPYLSSFNDPFTIYRIMRFSIFAAFMLPLAALAAPTPPAPDGFTQDLQKASEVFGSNLNDTIISMGFVARITHGALADKAHRASRILARARTALQEFSNEPSIPK